VDGTGREGVEGQNDRMTLVEGLLPVQETESGNCCATGIYERRHGIQL
jgi:hypothetical protein